MSDPDYILDVGGLPRPQPGEGEGKLRGRPWIAVHWRCCSTYSRIYRDEAGQAYEGRCPRCRRPVRVRVGAGGTAARFFEAG